MLLYEPDTWVTLTPSQPTTAKPMLWRTLTVKEQRIELVTPARKSGANISELGPSLWRQS